MPEATRHCSSATTDTIGPTVRDTDFPAGVPAPRLILHFDLIIVILCDAQRDVSISMLGNIPRGFEF
jgi:hypothetical protein